MKEGDKMPRPAKSAKLQLLQKNPNKKNTKELKKRAEAEEQLQMQTDKIKAPTWLDKQGKDIFEFIKEELLSVELVTNPDIYVMAMYCSWYSQYVVLVKQYKKMQREYKSEYQEKRKWLKRMVILFMNLRNFMEILCLSRWTLVLEIYVLLVAIWVCRPLREQN